MKMNTTFTVIARGVDIYNAEALHEDIELTFNRRSCEKLLLRFVPCNCFLLNNQYKMVIKFNNMHELIGLIIIDNENNKSYIVKNLSQLLYDVLDGYKRLVIMDKVSDIMEFDFKAGIELQTETEEEN